MRAIVRKNTKSKPLKVTLRFKICFSYLALVSLKRGLSKKNKKSPTPSFRQAKVDFLRLGQVHKILPEIQSYSAQRAAASIKTVNELKQFYESKVTNVFTKVSI